MLSAYFDDKPFSIDLTGAVIRQGSFIDKMAQFGWTEPGYFDDKEDELVFGPCYNSLSCVSASRAVYLVFAADKET